MTFRIDIDDVTLAPLVERIVAQVLGQLADGRLAYSEAEAARMLGIAPHVLRDRRLEGKIKATKIGKQFRYTRASLVALAEGLPPQPANLDRRRTGE